MTAWFTSDLHFGHLKVSEIRGFGTPMQHDFALIKNWERVVRKNDQVWVLGDLAVSSPTRALEIVAALPGRKHLISGNHDACHPMHRNSHKYLRRYLEAFDSVQPFARRRIEGREVLLSHFPYDRDRHDVRYTQYRLRNEGKWLLHGHTHGSERLSLVPETAREIHVGVDAWGLAPVSLDTIAAIMKEVDQ